VEPYKRAEQAKRDAAAHDYDRWYRQSKGARFDRYERDLFAQQVRRRAGERVLDLGSGTGRIAAAIADQRRIVVTDLSFESLAVNTAAHHLPAVCADAARLPFAEAAFDAIVCSQVLQHLMPLDLHATLLECRRILKPKGWLLCSLYNFDSPGNRRVYERGIDGGYRRWFTPGQISATAAAAGFLLDEIAYFKALPRAAEPVPGWAALDRAVCALPLVGRRTARYILARLRPQPGAARQLGAPTPARPGERSDE
jgi:ubiquinone/menaquinone biosynthesis C-methylase UbiE